MSLVWRGTFIDEPAPAVVRRTRSEPRNFASAAFGETFAGERQYVKSLNESLTGGGSEAASPRGRCHCPSLLRAPASPTPPADAKGASRATTRSTLSVTATLDSLDNGSSHSGSEGSRNGQTTLDQLSCFGDDSIERQHSCDSPEPLGCVAAHASVVGASDVWAPEQSAPALKQQSLHERTARPAAKIAVAPPPPPRADARPSAKDVCAGPTVGSVGHPGYCRGPCIHFARGHCHNGADCFFCHLPHRQRAAHLDKRHRELLRRLPVADRVALVLPKARRVLAQPSTSDKLQELLPRLEELALGASPDTRMHGSLASALGALKPRQLLAIAFKGIETPAWLDLEALDDYF